jgi:hypothetical protein
MLVNWNVEEGYFRGKDYLCSAWFLMWGKILIKKKLRINHGTKEVVVSTKEEINSKWMWLWSWLWNVIYICELMKCIYFPWNSFDYLK